MIVKGTYGTSKSSWVAKVQLLEIIEASKTKEELFIKLEDRILMNLRKVSKGLVKRKEFKIEITNDTNFLITFFEPKYLSGLLFKSLREKENFSQSQIADNLESNKNAYTQYENASREPSITKFTKILNAMGYEWELKLRKKWICIDFKQNRFKPF